MNSSKIFFVGISFVIIAHLATFKVSEAANSTTTVAPASQNSTKIVSLSIPLTNKSISLSVTKKESEEDCVDDEPVPEPEGKANATNNGSDTDNRKGKQINLNDNDKYSHVNGSAEPEPESEPGQNGTSLAGSKGKLTGPNGTATTLPPGRGAAASLHGSSCLAIGLIALLTACMKMSL